MVRVIEWEKVIRMTARKGKAKACDSAALRSLEAETPKGSRLGPEAAQKMITPVNRHAILATQFSGAALGGLSDEDKPTLLDYAKELQNRSDKAVAGDLTIASELLFAQAITLDGIFTEMARRSAANMGEYLEASERYMRLALKAQANSRATVEALAKLHQPREQTVRHVHVNEGGQAVIADQFHHHAGGQENGQTADQPHAQGARSAAMLGHDAQRNGVPIPEDQGTEQVQDARRQGKRRTQGQ